MPRRAFIIFVNVVFVWLDKNIIKRVKKSTPIALNKRSHSGITEKLNTFAVKDKKCISCRLSTGWKENTSQKHHTSNMREKSCGIMVLVRSGTYEWNGAVHIEEISQGRKQKVGIDYWRMALLLLISERIDTVDLDDRRTLRKISGDNNLRKI